MEDAQDVRVVHAIACWRPLRLGHDAAGFVETQCLAADAAASGDLSDPQDALGHIVRIDLAT